MANDAMQNMEAMRCEIVRLRAELAAALPERDRLREFAGRVLNVVCWGRYDDPDGGGVQDWAASLGIIRSVEVTEPCGENCVCAEVDDFPTRCYRLAWQIEEPARTREEEKP